MLGKNGSGKTTLIKLLIGLIRPEKGEISLLSESPLYFSDDVKERFGYVPQRERLYPWLSARELIDYTSSFYRNWNVELVNKLSSEWNIDLNEVIGNMSEGEAQKVAIMLALGHEPDLLVLDEPVASLDPLARRQFLKMILELVSERECTIFFSTHITSDLERVADRVALLSDGIVRFCGEIETLRETVKRVRILNDVTNVENILKEGIINHECNAEGTIVTINNYCPDLEASLKKEYDGKVIVDNLNLEEIFLELNR